mgnify:CR=1 FL=1
MMLSDEAPVTAVLAVVVVVAHDEQVPGRDDEIERDAGNGGQEIRTWIVAAAAWGGAMQVYGYEPQPAWLTGTACVAAFAS